MTIAPTIDRHRHELKRRQLTVAKSQRLSPHMHRLTLAGPELEGFVSLGFDDHVKLLVPGDEAARRDYTPRHYDAQRQELVVDFAVHDAGPATLWALSAQVGDAVGIGGPRGSAVIGGDIAHWLLIGDETALPAIGRKIEESGAGVSLTSLVAVPGPLDEQSFATAADLRSLWVHRPSTAATDPGSLLQALGALELPAQTFVWIAAEAGVARALRDHMLERGHALTWLKTAGYWVAGKADSTERFEA